MRDAETAIYAALGYGIWLQVKDRKEEQKPLLWKVADRVALAVTFAIVALITAPGNFLEPCTVLGLTAASVVAFLSKTVFKRKSGRT